MTANSEFNSELKEMGFKGKLLKDMNVMVQDEEDFRILEAFVISGNHRNMLSICSSFKQFMVSNSNIKVEDFVHMYERCSSATEKKTLVDRLTCSCVELQWICVLEDSLKDGKLTLVAFFQTNKLFPTLHIRRKISQAILDCAKFS